MDKSKAFDSLMFLLDQSKNYSNHPEHIINEYKRMTLLYIEYLKVRDSLDIKKFEQLESEIEEGCRYLRITLYV